MSKALLRSMNTASVYCLSFNAFTMQLINSVQLSIVYENHIGLQIVVLFKKAIKAIINQSFKDNVLSKDVFYVRICLVLLFVQECNHQANY